MGLLAAVRLEGNMLTRIKKLWHCTTTRERAMRVITFSNEMSQKHAFTALARETRQCKRDTQSDVGDLLGFQFCHNQSPRQLFYNIMWHCGCM